MYFLKNFMSNTLVARCKALIYYIPRDTKSKLRYVKMKDKYQEKFFHFLYHRFNHYFFPL